MISASDRLLQHELAGQHTEDRGQEAGGAHRTAVDVIYTQSPV